MPKCTIPLWLVFTLQSIVVSGAFMAVILVLVLQQQDQYTASVFREISLQQAVTNTALTNPIITRERSITQIKSRLELDPSLRLQMGDTLASSSVQAFMNLSFFIMYNDPIAYSISQSRLDPSQRIPNATGADAFFFISAAMTSDTTVGVGTVNNTVVVAPNPTYPLQFTTTITVPFVNTGGSSLVSPAITWSPAFVFPDPLTNEPKLITGLTIPFEFNETLGIANLGFTYVVDVHYLVGLAAQAILTPTTKAILVGRTASIVLANINVGGTEYDESSSQVWTLDTLPNRDIVARFNAADAKCLVANNCTQYAQEDGDEIVSLLHLTTDYEYSMSFFQITPRDHYFADGERATIVGSVIGVVAAVLVLMSCVVIWFAVRGPIRQLRDNMLLAAVMRNDEVSDTSSLLTELDLLSQSFTQMNDKLLQARAFMPQALLCGTDGDQEDEGDDSAQETPMSSQMDRHSVLVMSEQSAGGTSTTRSQSQSQSQRRISTTHTRGVVIPTDGTSLVPKRIGVLMINARGTHELVAKGSAGKLEMEQVRLVELVERCARAERGVVDSFQGDHFVVTFNAARAVGGPGRAGALTGLSLEDAAQRDGLVLGQFSMGLSVGRAFVGNVGSSTMKTNCIVGSVYTNASRLERLAKRVGRTCVVDGRCIRDLDHVVYCMLLGSVQLSSDAIDVAGCVMGNVEGAAGNQEWLYHMQGKADPYDDYNEVVEAYMEHGVEAARKGIDALSAKINEPGFGFLPAAIEYLDRLLCRHVKMMAISEEDRSDLYIGGKHPFGVDFDMRSA